MGHRGKENCQLPRIDETVEGSIEIPGKQNSLFPKGPVSR